MKRPLAMVALVTAIVIMGWLACSKAPPREPVKEGEALTLTGRVYDVQERSGYKTGQLWIYLDSIIIPQQDASSEEALVSYHLICQTDSSYRPLMGSRIQVTGQFEQFSHATNPGQFDAKDYYASLNIAGRLKNARITAISSRYSVVKEMLYLLREHWKARLYQYFPDKEASVLNAMLLGDKTELDEDIKDLYTQSGIIHILSISGLHITLLGMGFYRILRRVGCPVSASCVCSAVLLVLYGMMTGMGVSAVRAISMYLLRMLADILGRTYDMVTALGCVGIIMLAGRPEYITHTGFLLSFGSLCGIGVILPALYREEIGRNAGRCLSAVILSWMRHLKKAVLPGVSVTLTTLPIQLYYFYEIPVYSLLLNLLVLPFVGTVMVVGMIVMAVPGMSWLGQLDVSILGGYEWLCEMSEKLPYHTWSPGAPQVWQILVYYLLLLFGVFACSKKTENFRQKGMRMLFIASALLLLGWRIQPKLSVTFLDVGQGDGICVRAGKETYLFDFGSSSENKIGEYVLIPYLKHEGIHHLEGIFVSHPDKDHISGILELLALSRKQRITVERVVLPRIAEEKRNSEFEDILQAVAAMGEDSPQIVYMAEADFWQTKAVTFTCLNPPANTGISDSNAYSQCFLAEYGAFSMLLTGDVEGEGEQLLIQTLAHRGISHIDLLKVPHHGSRYSTQKELLDLLTPNIAVISCGADNPYGHPHQELLERLNAAACHTYLTPTTGAITITINKKTLQVKCFKPDC